MGRRLDTLRVLRSSTLNVHVKRIDTKEMNGSARISNSDGCVESLAASGGHRSAHLY